MPVQLYICNQIGTGTKSDPWRPAIAALPVNWDMGGTEHYQGIDHPARRFWVGIVYGSNATHDLCETVATSLLPTRPISVDEFRIALDALWDAETSAWKTTRQTVLETLGVSAAWLNATNHKRDVVRYAFRACFFAQMAEGEGNANVINLLSRNLDVTVAQLPTGVRQAGRDWLQAHGLAIGWITNQTTVRQIVHYVIENLGFGVINFQGQDF